MPYQLPERVATLVFEDGPLQGLEMKVRADLSLDAFFELSELLAKAVDKKTGLDSLRSLYQRFAEIALDSWDMTDSEGKPIPATAESLTGRMPPKSGMALIMRYLQFIGGTSDSLSPASRNGRTSKARRASSSRRR